MCKNLKVEGKNNNKNNNNKLLATTEIFHFKRVSNVHS
jgi:hypothetical protein